MLETFNTYSNVNYTQIKLTNLYYKTLLYNKTFKINKAIILNGNEGPIIFLFYIFT